MKIVLAAHTTPQSGVVGMSRGISTYIYNLALELRKMGHDVTLYVRDDYVPKEDWIKTVPAPRKWLFYPRWLANTIRDEKADVFHSDFITTGLALAIAGKRPCVVSAHDVIPWEESLPMKYLPLNEVFKMRYRRVAKHADAVIFMSDDASSRAPRMTGIDARKVYRVYNGVDLKRFKPARKPKHTKVRIGYLGGLDGRKNVTLLVEAYKILSARRKDVELHVGGSGSMLETFREMRLPNAKFYGHVEEGEKAKFYNSLDIFVFPSLMEGFGMMLVEAMACGLPVVGLDRSATPEIVADAGFLVNNDPNELAASMERLIDDQKLRRKLATKARRRAEEFSWNNCAKNTLAVYQRAIERAKR